MQVDHIRPGAPVSTLWNGIPGMISPLLSASAAGDTHHSVTPS